MYHQQQQQRILCISPFSIQNTFPFFSCTSLREFWWPGFPVLVYFKETQTRPEGQIHFFPLIFNGKQVYDVMVQRCGPSQGSGPK
jgi:hypothetical protein